MVTGRVRQSGRPASGATRPASGCAAVLGALVAIALDPAQPAAGQVVACREVLDRGHGKPRQAVELTGAEAGPVRIEDARARVLALIEAVAERTAGDVAGLPPS